MPLSMAVISTTVQNSKSKASYTRGLVKNRRYEMQKILIILCLFLGVTTVSAQRLKKQTITMEEFKQEVRENLNLDYSMSDYSISKIDSTVIGKHLASILNNLCKNYQQYVYLGKLSII